MKEVLAGIVSSCQQHRFENAPELKPRLLLRPTEEWTGAMIVGATVKLCLPNGKEWTAKIKGFELRSFLPKETPVAILIEELPELDNYVPAGTNAPGRALRRRPRSPVTQRAPGKRGVGRLV